MGRVDWASSTAGETAVGVLWEQAAIGGNPTRQIANAITHLLMVGGKQENTIPMHRRTAVRP